MNLPSPLNPAALPPPALDGEHAGAKLPKLRQMRMARVARRLMTWAAVVMIVGVSLTLVTPAVLAARPENAPIPLMGMLITAAQAITSRLAGWAVTLAAALGVAAALAWAPAWVQWRQARVPVALARRLRVGDRAGGIPLELLRIRIRWVPWRPWLPRRIRIRYPSGWVAADPAEELQELFLTDFRLPVRVDWQPAMDQIVVVRTRPATEPTVEPEAARVEDQSPMVGGVHTSIGPLLGGLTVDQDRTQLDEDGTVRELVLTYDQTTKDVSPRFRARVQSVIEAKVPSPTGAWTMRWQPDQHTVLVVPSEPLPEYAAYTGLPAGHNDPLAVPLGLGSGGRVVCWRPLKFPHLLLAGATGGGKALDLETPVPTPNGWTTMGDLRTGDELFDETGTVCRVVEAHPVRHGRPCHEVVFSDGERIVADAEHLWFTEDRAARVSRRRAQKKDSRRQRKVLLSPTHLPALQELCRCRDQVTLTEVARTAGLVRPPALLRSIAAAVGRVRVEQSDNTQALVFDEKRADPGTHIYPAAPLVRDFMAAGSRPLNDQRHRQARGAVRSTAEIAATLRHRGSVNHSIPVAGALQLPPAPLSIPPYVLGCWLGDGTGDSGGFTTADPEILTYIEADGYQVSPPRAQPNNASSVYTIYGLVGQLRKLGILALNGRGWPPKRIPRRYLRASVNQRRVLLAGLLDTDGTVTPHGQVHFDSTCRRLAEDVHELVLSLGYRGWISSKPARYNGRDCGTVWRVGFAPGDEVFRLTRKREAHLRRSARHHSERTAHRYIVDVRPVPSLPVRCITVDSVSRLYLAGRHMVPTHNTTCIRTVLVMALLLGWRVWILDPKQTSFQYFRNWKGVERVCITGEQIRQALLDHRDEMQEIYDGLLAGTITHDDITPLLLIFDEVTEGFADVAEWVEENFEDLKEDRPGAKLAREMKRGEFACWRVTRKGREARRWQLLGLQRPDTTFIPGEARDNLITRVAAGHLRGAGLNMVFEDPSVRQRVTRPKIDPATGEDRGEPIPGRSTADVGDGPEPLQWFYTPDPAPGRHTPEEMALLEHLREQVEGAQATCQQSVRPVLRVAPGGREERHSESAAAGDLEEGRWVLLDTDGGGERPVLIEGVEAEGDDMVTLRYRTAVGGVGDYEVDRHDELVLVLAPAGREEPQ